MTIAGRLTNADVINIEGLASEYTARASGRTITITNGDHTVVFQLATGATAVSVRFLDGSLDAAFNGRTATLGGARLTRKASDVNDTNIDATKAADGFDGSSSSNSGSTSAPFMLTAGVDAGAAFVGTSGNDTFIANVAVNPGTGVADVETLNALDDIDGGAGNDTLTYYTVGATALPAASIKNIETISMVSDGAATADVSNITGVTTLNVRATGAAVNVDAKANVTAVNVTGTATTVAVDDAGTAATSADKIATVSVTGATGDITIGAANAVDSLTALNLTKTTDGNATVTATAGTRSLTVTLNEVTGPANDVVITDDEATTLVVKTTGVKSSGIDLQADKATAVTIDADEELTITQVDFSAAKTIAINGDSLVTFTTNTAADLAALESVSSASSTGGVTLTTALATGVAFTGGAGKDTITVGATTKSINMGGNDDKVTVAAVAALGSGGALEGGTGTDTIAFSTFANAVTASGATTFAGTISGFERLELSGANAAAAAAINLANLDNINYVTLSATNTETMTISGMTSGGTIAFTADQTAGKDATVAITNASAGTADVLNVVLSKATALAAVELIAGDVETVNITSTETATTLLGTVTHAMELNATAAKSLNVSGNAGVTFGTLTGATALTSIDASGVSAGLVSLTTAALTAAATIKGGAGANTIVASAATKAVTYTGQDKVDTITINNALNNTVNTAGGNDVIVTGSGADTINGGAGDDNITSGAGLDQLTGGTGNDTFVLTNNSSGTIYATIKDAAAGDIIQVANKGTEVSVNGGTTLGAAITLGSAAIFTDYLNAATAGDGGTDGRWAWFQFNGNTYLVADQTAGATFTAATDFVVELTGLVNLTNSTGVATNAITIA